MDGGCEELCPPPRGRYDPRASLHPRRARGAARSGAVSTHQPIDARQSGPRARSAAMVSRRRGRDSRERHPARPVPPLPHQLARYARLVNPAGPPPSPARPISLCGVEVGSSDCRMSLFATKPIATLRAEAEATGEHALTRALGPLNLVTLGIGAVIGAGIFVITGQVAALYAGPAVPLSMILVGVACAFAGLCYAEMASAVLVIGIKESARVNSLIVILKVGIVLLVVLVGLPHVRPANWTPFIPPNTGEWGSYGWSGVLRGAGLVFFSYIGFDTVSTAAQESKNPQRDMPIGILGSLVICTLLYVVVSAVLV